MNRNAQIYLNIEKAFCAYIKIILNRTARDYYKTLYRYYIHTAPLDYFENDPIDSYKDLELEIPQKDIDYLEKYIENDILAQIVSTLKSKEKNLLYFKYFEDKTDKQMAMIYGIRQQSLNERKLRVLKKLRKQSQK